MKNKKRGAVNFEEMSVDKLSDYIAEAHHPNLKKSLAAFQVHFKTILKVEVERHPEVKKINEVFEELKVLLEQHLNKEEGIFFPYIKKLVELYKHDGQEVKSLKGLSKNPVNKIQLEHKKIKNLLAKIRETSNDYTPPVDAYPSLKLCYAQLFNFEQDIYKHIYLEERILFPKLVEFENRVANLK